jgi:hypothetical protein
VPEGFGVAAELVQVETSRDDAVARYWHDYLSDNGRKIYGAAANIEAFGGPGYTLEDLAENLSLTYESVRSMHRTTGRTARVWRENTNTEPPIELRWQDYDHDERHGGMRTTYHLPPDVADAILELKHSPAT